LGIDTASRYHAVITDRQSANEVGAAGGRIRTSATPAGGDRICVCGHESIFEIRGS
jgi:SARP family transcriptional regulator, regulator of embCAB operon